MSDNMTYLPIKFGKHRLVDHSHGPRTKIPVPQLVRPATPGRNDLCPCGSGRKFKKCHGGRL